MGKSPRQAPAALRYLRGTREGRALLERMIDELYPIKVLRDEMRAERKIRKVLPPTVDLPGSPPAHRLRALSPVRRRELCLMLATICGYQIESGSFVKPLGRRADPGKNDRDYKLAVEVTANMIAQGCKQLAAVKHVAGKHPGIGEDTVIKAFREHILEVIARVQDAYGADLERLFGKRPLIDRAIENAKRRKLRSNSRR